MVIHFIPLATATDLADNVIDKRIGSLRDAHSEKRNAPDRLSGALRVIGHEANYLTGAA